MLKIGQHGKVWVNQGLRPYIVQAVLKDRALIEYEMPAGGESLIEVDIKMDEVPKGEHYRSPWVNRAWGRLPKYWQEAVEQGVKDLQAMAQAAIDAQTKREGIDNLVGRYTGFRNLREMLDARGSYRPSIDMRDDWAQRVADAYDAGQEARGDARRAYRYGGAK